jgi:hypothetical protein
MELESISFYWLIGGSLLGHGMCLRRLRTSFLLLLPVTQICNTCSYIIPSNNQSVVHFSGVHFRSVLSAERMHVSLSPILANKLSLMPQSHHPPTTNVTPAAHCLQPHGQDKHRDTLTTLTSYCRPRDFYQQRS